MNKYQEAFTVINFELNRSPNDVQLFNDNEQIAARLTIKELVDRAIPRNVENWGYSEWEEGDYVIKSSQSGDCPNCHTRITMLDDEIHFCPACGQALEWEVK